MNDAHRAIRSIVDHGAGPIAIVRVLVDGVRRVARYDHSVGGTLLGMVAPKSGALSSTTGIREPVGMITEPKELPVFMHIPADRFDLDRTIPNFVCDGFTVTRSSIRFANAPTL